VGISDHGHLIFDSLDQIEPDLPVPNYCIAFMYSYHLDYVISFGLVQSHSIKCLLNVLLYVTGI
jgi:hypothetical protein